ncbi:MAG: DHH family phosphoesterase, partial [Desulfurivibrionaceae bacterium]
MSVCVVGHSNPDTDSVAAAIAYAHYLKATGTDAIACMQIEADKLNPESVTVLKNFGLAAPQTMMDAAGKKVALVDFSDIGQAPANIKDAEVVAIVDHHKIGDITTNNPIVFNAQPVGCTCTVLYEMF